MEGRIEEDEPLLQRRRISHRTSQLPVRSRILYKIEHYTVLPAVAPVATAAVISLVVAIAILDLPKNWVAAFELSVSSVTLIMVFAIQHRASDTGHIQNSVDPSEGVKGCGKHCFDLILLCDIAIERNDTITKFGGGLLLASTDIGGQHLRVLPYENPRRRPGHPGPCTGVIANFPSNSAISLLRLSPFGAETSRSAIITDR